MKAGDKLLDTGTDEPVEVLHVSPTHVQLQYPTRVAREPVEVVLSERFRVVP